jgi:RNA polymerase sigma-70 factor (ECF subfamily)
MRALEGHAHRRQDRRLVRAALDGDPGAREELGMRLACVPRILSSKNQALAVPLAREELGEHAQEVVLRLWNKLRDYRGEARLETWIHGFCSLELRGAARRSRSRTGPLPETIAQDAEERSFESGEFASLRRNLARLTPEQAACIRLRWYQEASFREIGARLELPTGTVKTHYYRGMERLRRWLAPRREGPSRLAPRVR